MINTLKLQCSIERGKPFEDDIIIPKYLRVIQKVNTGDLIEYGRNKGCESDYSYLILSGSVDEILDFINDFFPERDDLEINLTLLISYTNECNFEITKEEIQRISKLMLPLAITCYEK